MSKLTFDGIAYNRTAEESVLDCLTRHGVVVPNSCRSGICQSCMLRAVSDDPPAAAQKGLKETQKEQRYFLACSCIPSGDFEATSELPQLTRTSAQVRAVEKISPAIARVRLDYSRPFDYRPGQFLNLYRPDGLIRTYSIASVPQFEDFIELHVQRTEQGRMSRWVHEELKSGDLVHISAPLGECYYRPGNTEQPILMVGTGSGLAPLYGVLRDALRAKHSAPIWLYHGSRTRDGLYLIDELRSLAREYENFRYFPCLSRESGYEAFLAARANDAALTEHKNLKGWRVFIAGHADMVGATKKRVFLAGASLGDIHSDAFLLARN